MELIKVIFAILVVVLSGCTMLSQRSDFVAQLQLPKPNVSENWCEKNTVKNGSITYGSLGYVERNSKQVCVFQVDNGKGGVDLYYINENFEIELEKYANNQLVFSGVYENNTLDIIKTFDEASTSTKSNPNSCSSSSQSASGSCGLTNGSSVVVVTR